MVGTLVISFDTELGWGAIENGLWRRREAAGVYEKTRQALGLLLKRMDSLEIPATWAIVGGLLEKPGTYDLEHLPLPARRAAERVLSEAREDTFYGPDVVETIKGARVAHEIGCHTYSHTRFTYPAADETFAREELTCFTRVFSAEGLGIAKSLIFPRDEERFPEQVAEAGMKVYRGKSPTPGGARAARLLHAATRPPRLSEISEPRPGLTRTTASVFFNSRRRRPHRLPFVLLQALRGLRLAAATGGTLHVYNHPFNFAEAPGLLGAYGVFLREATRMREAGSLRVKTMAELG